MMKPGRRSEILEIATRILEETKQGREWPTDLEAVVASAGVSLEWVDEPQPFDGRFEYLDGLPLIIVNRRGGSRDSGRVRFTLGHELAHYILHRRLAPADWKPHDDVLDVPNDVNEVEQEANLLSSGLLFPRSLLRHHLKLRVVGAEAVQLLAESAKASVQAAAIAISQETTTRCLFLFEVGGVIKWVAASDEWKESRLPWSYWNGKNTPSSSVVAPGKPPISDYMEERLNLWAPNQDWREGNMFAAAIGLSVGRMIVLTCSFDSDDALEDWDD